MLLDALTYLIDADNSQLNKEIDKSDKKAKDLGESLTETEKRAKNLTDKAAAGFKRLGAAILAVVAVNKVLSDVNAYAQSTEKVRTLSETLGIAVDDVDAFGKSVEALGGNAEGAQQSLSALTEKIGGALKDAASGEAKMFSDLGVSLKDTQGHAKSTIQVLGEMSDKLAGMSRQEATFRLKQMGISDPKTIEAMVKGRQELDRMMREQKEAGVVTKEAAEQAKKYTQAQAKLSQVTRSATDKMAAVLLPFFTMVINGFSRVLGWMNDHGDFIKGFFIAVGVILATVYGPAVIAAAVGTWALISPFVAVGAALAALAVAFALVYDDIVNFMEGNDSLIGQISEVFPAIGEIAKYLYNVVSGVFKLLTGDFEGAKESFAAAGQAVINIFTSMSDTIIEALNTLFEWLGLGPNAASKMADGMVSNFVEMSDSIKSVFTQLTEFVGKVWKWIKGVYDKSIGMVTGLASKVGGWFGLGGEQSSAAANETLSSASANPLNSVTSNAISNSSNSSSETNVTVGQVTVQTQATDASGISKDIGSELRGQLDNIQSEAASGTTK